MKRKIWAIIFPFLAVMLLFWHCETDVDLNDEWQDIPVVYSILSQNDEVHHVRVNRAFLGKGDALQMASQLDSITYDPGVLEVRLLEKSGDAIQREFLLDTVLVDNVEPGVFSYPEQIVYRTPGKIKLSPDYTYELEIYNTERDKYIEGETDLIHDFSIKRPMAGQKFWNFASKFSSEVSWFTAENGRLYELSIHAFYTNYHDNGDIEKKTLEWNFPRKEAATLSGGNEMSMEIMGEQFYVLIKNTVQEISGIERTMDSVRFKVSVADDEFNTYMKINRPSSGIVQERPEYSNVSNGIGLVASRYSKGRTVELTSVSQDSLVNGQHTYHLGFVKPIP
ncbi:MAG: hypothetical protein R6U19_02270 [Bacteroidales bacterium]